MLEPRSWACLVQLSYRGAGLPVEHIWQDQYTRLAPILLILRQDLFCDVLLPWVSNVYI